MTSWSYDNRGNNTAKVYPDNAGPSYTYDADGNLQTRTWARGIVTTYAYDAAGRATGQSYSDGTTAALSGTFNYLDRLTALSDASGMHSFNYNTLGQLANETNPVIVNGATTYDYDALGRLTMRRFGVNNTTHATASYGYDVEGRIATLGNGSDTLTYTYRAGLNQLASAGWRNSAGTALNSRSYGYDGHHRLTEVKVDNVRETAYTLNDKDQRTKTMFNDGSYWDYSYDEKGQVTGAVRRAADGSELNYGYTYDGIGNRRTASEEGSAFNYSSNLLNQYTQINTTSPLYDADGNMTVTGDGWNYTWNGENRLTIAESGETRMEANYDYMGRRFEKKVYGKGLLSLYSWNLEKHYKYAYDGYKLIAVYDVLNNNALLMSFTWQPDSVGQDVPVSMTYEGQTYYYVTDGSKNVTGLLDAAGVRVADYTYGPFGQVLTMEGAMAEVNPFRFSSEYADDETGLVYYNYRYYSPKLGRWTKRDPIGEQGGVNEYAMINNEISNKIDRHGLTPFSEMLNFKDNLRRSLDLILDPFVGAYKALIGTDKYCCINGQSVLNEPVMTGVSINEGFVRGSIIFSFLIPAHTYIQIDDIGFGLFADSHVNNGNPLKAVFDKGVIKTDDLQNYPSTNTSKDDTWATQAHIKLSPCEYDIEKFRECILSKRFSVGNRYMVVGNSCGDFAKNTIRDCKTQSKRKK